MGYLGKQPTAIPLSGSDIVDDTIESADIKAGTIVDSDISGSAAIGASKLASTLDLSSKTVTLPAASVTAHAVTPTLDSPVITGTLTLLPSAAVTHTIANWSDDVSYTITPTNCTAGAVNGSGEFVITHTSGIPSYTIKATTASLGLDDSGLVTKNITLTLTAPTLSSPADVGTATNVIYTITSTDSNDDKLILDPGTANFTYQSVSVGSASKVGNTVECTGFTTNNPAVTIQFTAEATYSVTAKAVKIDGTYGTSANSSADSITIQNTYNIEYLVIAGGGGGGGPNGGGGGGGGGYRTNYASETSGGASSGEATLALTPGVQHTVTVGAGGTNTSSYNVEGGNGEDSVFGSITSLGGGGGGGQGSSSNSILYENGLPGGSGGGAAREATGTTGRGTTGQGSHGGTGSSSSGGSGGGGGGASAVGVNGSTSAPGGNGGAGQASAITTTGSTVTRAGGGGGGIHPAGAYHFGDGGAGGGGRGGNTSGAAVAGGTNTGGGGGGAGHVYYSLASAVGGSGVVILRIPDANYSGTTTGSPTVDTSTIADETILIFNDDGTYTA